jgi:transcriptional regulator GlxA family with amidase domain
MRNVAILLFDEVEVLDFAGPFELFSVTGRRDAERPFNVYTVAEKTPITARNGLSINPAYLLETCPPPDIIVVPGGAGTRRAMQEAHILDWVRQMDSRTELTLSVCTGALILGKAGLLDGIPATTHYGAYDLLQETVPTAAVQRGVRYVDHGRIVTSAGVQAGMDMSLHVIARLLGQEAAEETARYIEYEWREMATP